MLYLKNEHTDQSFSGCWLQCEWHENNCPFGNLVRCKSAKVSRITDQFSWDCPSLRNECLNSHFVMVVARFANIFNTIHFKVHNLHFELGVSSFQRSRSIWRAPYSLSWHWFLTLSTLYPWWRPLSQRLSTV